MQREDRKKERKMNEMGADKKVKKESWELGVEVKQEERTKEKWRGDDDRTGHSSRS